MSGSLFLETLGQALLHSLWQGTAIALLVALACACLTSARWRYAVRATGLVGVLVALVATTVHLLSHLSEPHAAGVPAGGTAGAARVAPSVWVAGAWATGVAVALVRLGVGWWRVRALRAIPGRELPPAAARSFRRLARQLGVRATARVVESTQWIAPVVLGCTRPLVLIPAQALTGLSRAELEAVLAHELAHVRRFDFLVNLVQALVEALLFHHPAVWWLGATMRREREFCCDDIAVRLTHDPLTFARALTRVEAWKGEAPSFGVSAKGGPLMKRIRRLIEPDARPARRGAAGLSLALMTSLLGLGLSAAADAQEKGGCCCCCCCGKRAPQPVVDALLGIDALVVVDETDATQDLLTLDDLFEAKKNRKKAGGDEREATLSRRALLDLLRAGEGEAQDFEVLEVPDVDVEELHGHLKEMLHEHLEQLHGKKKSKPKQKPGKVGKKAPVVIDLLTDEEGLAEHLRLLDTHLRGLEGSGVKRIEIPSISLALPSIDLELGLDELGDFDLGNLEIQDLALHELELQDLDLGVLEFGDFALDLGGVLPEEVFEDVPEIAEPVEPVPPDFERAAPGRVVRVMPKIHSSGELHLNVALEMPEVELEATAPEPDVDALLEELNELERKAAHLRAELERLHEKGAGREVQ